MFDASEVVITSSRNIDDSDLTAIIWNSRTGEKLNKFRGGGLAISHGLIISGGYLIGIDEKKPLLHTWNLNSNNCGSAGQLLISRPKCIDATSSIGLVALGVEDSVQLYQMGTGRLLANVGKKFQPVTTIKFSKDASLIACGSIDGLIILWNTGTLIANGESAEPFLVFKGHSLPVNDLLFTSGGLRSRIISVSTDRSCKIHDLVSRTLISTVIYNIGLTSLALHLNENNVFLGNKMGGIHELALNLRQGGTDCHLTLSEHIPEYSGHTAEITALSTSSYQALLLSGSADGIVKIWDIVTKNCLRSLEHKGAVTNVFFILVPSNIIEKTYTPSFILPHHCVPYDTSSKGKPEEVFTPLDLSTDLFLLKDDNRGKGTNEEFDSKEIAKLKSMNQALYLFSVNRILNKRLKFNTTANKESSPQKTKSNKAHRKKGKLRSDKRKEDLGH